MGCRAPKRIALSRKLVLPKWKNRLPLRQRIRPRRHSRYRWKSNPVSQRFSTISHWLTRLDKLREIGNGAARRLCSGTARPTPSPQTLLIRSLPRVRIRSINSESGDDLFWQATERKRGNLRASGTVAKTTPASVTESGKKNYDTLVKEAEQDILAQKKSAISRRTRLQRT